jgi:hypothetical protein
MAGSSSPNLEMILTSSFHDGEEEIRDWCGLVVQITVKVNQKQGENTRILQISIE